MSQKFYTPIEMQAEITAAKHVVTKEWVESRFRDLDYQGDVLAVQTDATLDPGAAPQTNDQYILTTVSTLHANFGTITKAWDGTALTLANNDIVRYTGTEFRIVYDVSIMGEGASAWNRTTHAWLKWTGTAWEPLNATSKYPCDFNDTTDWTGASAPYTITKSAATHGLGATKYLNPVVFEDGSPNAKAGCDITVADNGTVVISSEVKFAGYMIIM